MVGKKIAMEISATVWAELFDLAKIAFGWVLGVASLPITEWLKRRRRQGALQGAIADEMQHLRYWMGWNVFVIRKDRGTIDEKLIDWLEAIARTYDGPKDPELESIEQQFQVVRNLLKRPELTQPTQINAGVALRL